MSEFDHMKVILEKTGLYDASDGTLLSAELKAYAVELDRAFGLLNELERECFIGTAQSYGLSIREGMLRRMNLDPSLSGRRNQLINALSVTPNDVTAQDMEKICGSFNCSGVFTVSDSDLKVTFHPDQTLTEGQKAQLTEQMRRFMPCWSEFEI